MAASEVEGHAALLVQKGVLHKFLQIVEFERVNLKKASNCMWGIANFAGDT